MQEWMGILRRDVMPSADTRVFIFGDASSYATSQIACLGEGVNEMGSSRVSWLALPAIAVQHFATVATGHHESIPVQVDDEWTEDSSED